MLGLASGKLRVQMYVVKQHGVLHLELSVWVLVAFGYALLGFVEFACADKHAKLAAEDQGLVAVCLLDHVVLQQVHSSALEFLVASDDPAQTGHDVAGPEYHMKME